MTMCAFNLLFKEAVRLTAISQAIFMVILLLTPGPEKYRLLENAVMVTVSSVVCFVAFGFYAFALQNLKSRNWIVFFVLGFIISIIFFSIATLSFEVAISEIMIRNLDLNIIPHGRAQHIAAVMQVVSLGALIGVCWKRSRERS